MEPMLARLVRELPVGDGLFYEPKWDGFRCLASRDGAFVDLRSRNRCPLALYAVMRSKKLGWPQPGANKERRSSAVRRSKNF